MYKYYDLVCKIGYHISYIGYLYLADGIEYAVNNYVNAYQSADGVYQHIAKKHHSTTEAVAKAVSRAVIDIWDFNREGLVFLTGRNLYEKLTPLDLILYCATYIITSENKNS